MSNRFRRQQTVLGANQLNSQTFSQVSLLDGTVVVSAFPASIERAFHLRGHATHPQSDHFGLKGVPAAAATVQGSFEGGKTHTWADGSAGWEKRAFEGR